MLFFIPMVSIRLKIGAVDYPGV